MTVRRRLRGVWCIEGCFRLLSLSFSDIFQEKKSFGKWQAGTSSALAGCSGLDLPGVGWGWSQRGISLLRWIPECWLSHRTPGAELQAAVHAAPTTPSWKEDQPLPWRFTTSYIMHAADVSETVNEKEKCHDYIYTFKQFKQMCTFVLFVPKVAE